MPCLSYQTVKNFTKQCIINTPFVWLPFESRFNQLRFRDLVLSSVVEKRYFGCLPDSRWWSWQSCWGLRGTCATYFQHWLLVHYCFPEAFHTKISTDDCQPSLRKIPKMVYNRCARCNHSCKKCFCLRDPVFWGGIFLILRRNFPNMDEKFS